MSAFEPKSSSSAKKGGWGLLGSVVGGVGSVVGGVTSVVGSAANAVVGNNEESDGDNEDEDFNEEDDLDTVVSSEDEEDTAAYGANSDGVDEPFKDINSDGEEYENVKHAKALHTRCRR